MSQIMKALQESEMNHQAGQSSSVASASLSQQQPKSTGWLFYSVFGVDFTLRFVGD